MMLFTADVSAICETEALSFRKKRNNEREILLQDEVD